MLPFSTNEFNGTLSNQLVNKLIRHFKDAGFDFSDFNSSHYFVNTFHWPNIILSDKVWSEKDVLYDKRNSDSYGVHELLGAYSLTGYYPASEGTIIIYYEMIMSYAVDYVNDQPIIDGEYRKEVIKYFEAITAIVHLHQFVHWIMHCKVGFVPLKYHSVGEENFHKGFAQLFTLAIINELMLEKEVEGKLLKKLFLWLETRQDKKYTVYNEFKLKDSTELISIKEAIGILKQTKQMMTQNYNSLKEYFKTGSFPKPSDEENYDRASALFREIGLSK